MIAVVALSSGVDGLLVVVVVVAAGGVVVVVVVLTVVVPDVFVAAEWLTPAITVAVRAAPAMATAPPAMPARRRRRSEDGFLVMTITMRPGASRPSHHSVKRSLRPLRRCQCPAGRTVPR